MRLYLDNAPWGPRLCGAEAEAQHWAETGQINLARAQWVALGLRGLSRKQKLALSEDMATMEWPPTWAEPPDGNTTARKEKPVAL